jgi:hypothetical protein
MPGLLSILLTTHFTDLKTKNKKQKNRGSSWVQSYKPMGPATREAEVGGSLETSLGNIKRLCLKF